MELRKRVGKRIRELRINAGLKQAELAEIVGIATKTQSSIECGINFPKPRLIENYAKAFNLDVADIFYLYDTPAPKDDYKEALCELLNKANNKQIELIYKHAKLVMEG